MEDNLDMMLFGGGSRGRRRADQQISSMGSGIKTGAVPVMKSSGMSSRNQMPGMNSLYGMNLRSLKLTTPEDLDEDLNFFKRLVPKREAVEEEMFCSSSLKFKKKK
jgi:hypothetical protein